jgi:outer membrane protein assembly factor BamB
MSLKGNLSSVNLTEIFQMLSLSGREGTLFIYEGSRKRAICFTKEGVSIRSRERNENNLIGKILVRLGKIRDEDLQRAVEERNASNRLLGDILVDMGACAKEDVELAFRIQSEEDIQDLFLNRSDAQFEYVDGFFPESDGSPFVNLNVNSLLIEIARRSDEWEYIRRRIRGPREIYRFTGAEGTVDADVLAECCSHRIDALIDGVNSVGDIIELSYVNRFEVCKLLAAYLDAGVIELVPPDAIRQTARQALRSGDAATAIRHYDYLMSTSDFPPDVLVEAAEAYEETRDYGAAASMLRRYAEDLVRAGDPHGAVDALRRVATFPQPDPDALRYLIDLVLEHPQAAEDFAAQAIEAGKTLVALLVKNDQRGEALLLLERLGRAFPDEVSFAVSLVNVHYEEGRVDRAAQECERLANAFLRRKRTAHAVSLYKKLLVIDPERQDIRERIRKLVSGRRRVGTGGSAPRVLVALAVALVLGGAAVVLAKRPASAPSAPSDGASEVVKKLLARLGAEMESAQKHGGTAARHYEELVGLLGADAHAARDALRNLARKAEESYGFYDDHARNARSVGDALRRQAQQEESLLLQAGAMVAALKDLDAKVQSARSRWLAEAHSAAVRLLARGEDAYREGRLQEALERFELARLLSAKEEWQRDVGLDRLIANLRKDVEKVRDQLRIARTRENEGNWTAARQVYLDLLREFPGADVVGDVRLPAEVLSIPPGATVLLDGVAHPQPTPAMVRLDPFRATRIVLRRKGYADDAFEAGPFGPKTESAEFAYLRRLEKTPTWRASLEGALESTPAAARGRVAAAGRNGKLRILQADSGRLVREIELKSLEGIVAGIGSDGERFFVADLGGTLYAFECEGACREIYRLPGFPHRIYATPVVVQGKLVVVDYGGNVYAYEAATGKSLWKQATAHGVRGGVAAIGSHLVVATAGGRVTVLACADGTVASTYDLQGVFASPPAVAGRGELVFGSEEGVLYGVEALTGTVRWRRDMKSPIRGSPVVRGRLVFAGTRPGEMAAVNGHTGDLVGLYGGAAADARAPVAATDRILFAAGDTLAAFAQRGDGSYGLAWTFQAEARISSGPVVAGEAVYVGDERGKLYRLETGD